jgi:hypothetical protein
LVGDVIQHIASLVHLAALNWRRFAGILFYRRVQRFAAVLRNNSISKNSRTYHHRDLD